MVFLGERLRDGKAETDPLGTFVALIKSFKNVRQVLARDRCTVVFDRNRMRFEAQSDRLVTIFDSIIEEDRQNLHEVGPREIGFRIFEPSM